MATYMYYRGRLLAYVQYRQSEGGGARQFAEHWVDGKPKRRVVIRTNSETITIRGTATRKGDRS